MFLDNLHFVIFDSVSKLLRFLIVCRYLVGFVNVDLTVTDFIG